RALVARVFPGTDDALPLVASLLAVPDEASRAPALSPQLRKQRIQELVVELVARLAAPRPLVLVIEDLHWMDESSLELVGLLARRVARAPVLVVMTARPLFEPPWPVDGSIALSRLGEDEVASMIEQV